MINIEDIFFINSYTKPKTRVTTAYQFTPIKFTSLAFPILSKKSTLLFHA